MGNKVSPPPKDSRIEKEIKRVGMADEQLNALFQLFCRYDVDGSGYVSKINFLNSMIDSRRNLLTDALCELCDVRDSQEYITYPDFIVIVCTYSLFEPMDMMKFCFCIFDREKKGFIDKDEFKHFLAALWEYKLNANLQHALEYLEELDSGDGQFTFDEVWKAYCAYPSLFYPVFQLQVHLQRYTLGEKYWEDKKVEITENVQLKRRMERDRRKKKISDGEKALQEAGREKDDALIKHMGIMYYLTPWKRNAEREMLKKIAAVDAALEAEQKAVK